MSHALALLIGAVLGGSVGCLVAALLVAARRADDELDEILSRRTDSEPIEDFGIGSAIGGPEPPSSPHHMIGA